MLYVSPGKQIFYLANHGNAQQKSVVEWEMCAIRMIGLFDPAH